MQYLRIDEAIVESADAADARFKALLNQHLRVQQFGAQFTAHTNAHSL